MGMKTLYKLKDMLCQELDEIADKGDLGAGDLDIAHKLTDTVKNIYKIEALSGQAVQPGRILPGRVGRKQGQLRQGELLPPQPLCEGPLQQRRWPGPAERKAGWPGPGRRRKDPGSTYAGHGDAGGVIFPPA